MGRVYSVSSADVSVSATQDLLNLTATANMAFKLLRFECGQRSLATTWEAKPIRFRRVPATVTAGSGGSAVTPRPYNNGDAAATVTARANDTTAMTSSGTIVDLLTDMFVFFNGFLWVSTPRDEIIIAPSQGLAINMPTAPSGATNISCTAVIEEMF